MAKIMIDYVLPDPFENEEIYPTTMMLENNLDLSDLQREEADILSLPVEEMLKLFDMFQETANFKPENENNQPQKSPTPVPDSEDEMPAKPERKFKQRFTNKFHKELTHTIPNNAIEKKKLPKLILKCNFEKGPSRIIMKSGGKPILLNKNTNI